MEHMITKDTMATLLLCSSLGRPDTDSEPLRLRDYNRLARALGASEMRPGDLLDADPTVLASVAASAEVSVDRLQVLLRRGGLLGMTVEGWQNAGFWVVSRADEEYPERLKTKLAAQAPPLLYGVGARQLLERGGVAIVGSRAASPEDTEFTSSVAGEAAAAGISVISGGARGVDAIAMNSALAHGGAVVGVLANDLAKAAREVTAREAIEEDTLCLCSPYPPNTGFSVGAAMGRNKCVYALADWAVVVAAEEGRGGTWAGAAEDLKAGWTPVFLGPSVLAANALVHLGAHEWPGTFEKVTDFVPNDEPMPLEPSGQSGQMGLF